MPTTHSLNLHEFSRVTGLSVAAAERYFAGGILPQIGVEQKIRANQISCGRLVFRLLQQGFSHEMITRILSIISDSTDCFATLSQRLPEMQRLFSNDPGGSEKLATLIKKEDDIRTELLANKMIIETKTAPAILAACIRFSGNAHDTGLCLGILNRKMAGNIAGKPFCLFYDAGILPGKSDIEACIPVHKNIAADAVIVREIPEMTGFAIHFSGSYELSGRAYERLFTHFSSHQTEYKLPFCETYLKGSGMAMQGNPASQKTEIFIPIAE
ncbi:MAG: GyrI-like domain-containing protein [Calditrichia bacterium]|nr:GyrI-like domain-containing protein [Calditrichia bacterium]